MPVWILALITYGLAWLVAGFLGLEYIVGSFWAGALIFAAVTLHLTLPVTIGAFIGALKVWEWHWAFAVLFTAPGLALIVPGILAEVFAMLKNKRLIVAAALLVSLQACTAAGPYVTNISSDGNYGLTVEKCTVHMNAFMGTVSTGECTTHDIKLQTPK